VINTCDEFDIGGLEGVLRREVEFYEKGAVFVRCAGRTGQFGSPFVERGVVGELDGAVAYRTLLELFQFLGEPL